MFFIFQECLKFVKNVHFSESDDFTAKSFHPSDPLSDLHLDATTSLMKVSLIPYFVWFSAIASYLLRSICLNMYCRF